MKSKIVAGCIGFTFGTFVGILGTHFFLREKVDRTINEEVESYKRHLREKVENLASVSDSEGEEKPSGHPDDKNAKDIVDDDPKASKDHPERPKEKVIRTDYTSFYNKPDPESLVYGGEKRHTVSIEELDRVGKESKDPDFNQHFAEREYPQEDTEYETEDDTTAEDEECAAEAAREEMLKYEDENDGKPYVIPMTEFDYGREWYEKVTLTYYEQDDTLCNEGEEIIHNVDDVISYESLTHFGDGSNDEDVVYVRNPAVDTDFMVVRVNASYSETVCGFENIRMRRRKDRGRDEEDG